MSANSVQWFYRYVYQFQAEQIKKIILNSHFRANRVGNIFTNNISEWFKKNRFRYRFKSLRYLSIAKDINKSLTNCNRIANQKYSFKMFAFKTQFKHFKKLPIKRSNFTWKFFKKSQLFWLSFTRTNQIFKISQNLKENFSKTRFYGNWQPFSGYNLSFNLSFSFIIRFQSASIALCSRFNLSN